MNQAIAQMLKKYKCITTQDYINALKEILQEVALLGLWRSKFFEHAAFYGGTALRILYGLDRFSEDLDFSLLQKDSSFNISPYLQAIKTEIQSFGFDIIIQQKEKQQESAILSAFLKGSTTEMLLVVESPKPLLKFLTPGSVVKIKLEIDTQPPLDFTTESKYLLHPIPFQIKTFVAPDLFAGKMHAVLCRAWQNRVKGRDWYDFVWFVSQGIPLHLKHLGVRMKESGHLQSAEILDQTYFKEILSAKIDSLDIENSKQDILPFLKSPDQIAIWSKDFFHAVASQIKIM